MYACCGSLPATELGDVLWEKRASSVKPIGIDRARIVVKEETPASDEKLKET